MSEPTTEAGRALLAHMRSGVAALFSVEIGDESDDAVPEAILAIEAEAAQRERERLRALVQAIANSCHSRSGLACDPDAYGGCYLIDRSAVLALLADPTP